MKPNTYLPGSLPDTVCTEDGRVLPVPRGWSLLPPGDAALTRRVKQAGEHWLVQEKVGRKLFSRGLWAPSDTIEQIRGELEAERTTQSYAKRKASASQRRARIQTAYVEDFVREVVNFLAFHPAHAELATRFARKVAEHATPISSGTVARTQRIPIEKRAEAAVIAWMRHKTTAYDAMVIPRIKGKRREVRKMLAMRSRELLARYRRESIMDEQCPIAAALSLADN